MSNCESRHKYSTIKTSEALIELLQEMKQAHDQPAIAAAIVHDETIVAEAATGEIVYNGGVRVNETSRFHIGSTTKSMTAMLVAMFVKQGMLAYDMTLKQLLPDITMRDEYHDVTIENILNNQAGIIAFQLTTMEDPEIVKQLMETIPATYPDPVIQRQEVAKLALSLEPIAAPGTKTIYSNVGWAILGHVLEQAAAKPYEEILQELIFDPLGMHTARIGGWPASPSEPDQPRGHYFDPERRKPPTPQDLDDEYTLSPWMNPSGGVHCSIHDYAIYIQEHLLGLKGKGKLLDKDAYNTMHSVQVTTSMKEMYPYRAEDREVSFGYGWAVMQHNEKQVSMAAGSGGTFFAQMYIDPSEDIAFVGFTNCGNGAQALLELQRRVTGQ
jgi:CubicO group peptidase (beta-lactamase class C family)